MTEPTVSQSSAFRACYSRCLSCGADLTSWQPTRRRRAVVYVTCAQCACIRWAQEVWLTRRVH